MLLDLSSISSHTSALGLTSGVSPLHSPSKRAVSSLLRLVLYPRGHRAGPGPAGLGLVDGVPGGRGADHIIARLPSFLGGGGPCDLRGRVACKTLHFRVQQLFENGKVEPCGIRNERGI